MSLKILNRFPGANAVSINVNTKGDIPEVTFASDPCGGTEALWFYFKLSETEPDANKSGKVKITWAFVDNVPGGSTSSACIPVSCVSGHTWSRLKQGEESRTEEGLKQLSWLIPHPAPTTEIAFCFPYGPQDLQHLIQRSKDYWHTASIGISQGGRKISRVYNTLGTSAASQPGIYLMARQHAGETPGSWVLDGFLRHWGQSKKGGYVIWSHPIADIDGVMRGNYGRSHSPDSLTNAWTEPSSRHEAAVIMRDIMRWKERCRPVLAIDLQSPDAAERDGVFAVANHNQEETKWCNTIQNELQAEYAAREFKHPLPEGLTNDFGTFMRETVGVPTIILHIPYAMTGKKVLSQKYYREIGQRLAAAVLKRKG